MAEAVATTDAIGDTVFSETFVLKTLLQLSEVSTDASKWTDSLEQDLSGLWDMAGFDEVATLLVDNHFLTIARDVLANTEPDIPRMMEQVVGIVANMCTVTDVQIRIARHPDLLHLLARMLACTDALTLVQVVRLHTVLFRVISTCDCAPLETDTMMLKEIRRREAESVHSRLKTLGVSLITLGSKEEEEAKESATPESVDVAGNKIGDALLPHFVGDGDGTAALVFVLKGSTHGELLAATLGLVGLLCQLDVNDGEPFAIHLASVELVRALILAGTQLSEEDDEDEGVLDDEEDEGAFKDLVQTLETFARLEETRPYVCQQGEVVMAALVKFCSPRPSLLPEAISVLDTLLTESSLVSDTALAMVLSASRRLHATPWDRACEDEEEEGGGVATALLGYLRHLWLLNKAEPFLEAAQADEVAAVLIAEDIIPAT